MTLLVLIGLGAGAGVCLLVAGTVRLRPSLGSVVDRYPDGSLRPLRPGSAGPLPAPPAPRLLATVGRRLGSALASSKSSTGLGQDLALLGRSEEAHAATTALAAICGAAAPVIGLGALSLLGAGIPPVVITVGCPASFLAGALVPSVSLRRTAARARAALVHSIACWLELVALAQAGGMGIESALEAASTVTDDASFARLRQALERSRHAGRSPWDGLSRLGRELGVAELEELAASVALAGTEGARIRASLTAKSASLRRRQMAQAESRANSTTERLFLPAIVLMVGFMVFLVYPAAVTLTHALGPSLP